MEGHEEEKGGGKVGRKMENTKGGKIGKEWGGLTRRDGGEKGTKSK